MATLRQRYNQTRRIVSEGRRLARTGKKAIDTAYSDYKNARRLEAINKAHLVKKIKDSNLPTHVKKAELAKLGVRFNA